MPLLGDEYFEPIASILKDSRVGYLRMHGNVGDRLIDWATEQYLSRQNIVHCTFDRLKNDEPDGHKLREIDTILVAGGGNLGRLYDACYTLRRRYLFSKKRIVVLPQSYTPDEEDLGVFDIVFFRESWSQSRFQRGILAPDMALAFEKPDLEVVPDLDIGVFLREDSESAIHSYPTSLGDPAALCHSVTEYLTLAGRCNTIYTDRLHFAIAGMIMARNIYLLPCTYPKNRAMYDTWLKDLGCQWCDDVSQIPPTNTREVNRQFKTLVLPEGEIIPWHTRPKLIPGIVIQPQEDGTGIITYGQSDSLELEEKALSIVNALDGTRSLNDVLAGVMGDAPLEDARDVQYIVRTLRDCGYLWPEDHFLQLPKKGLLLSRDWISYQCSIDRYNLHVEGMIQVAGCVRYQAYFTRFGHEAIPLWFESDSIDPSWVSRKADPFLLAILPLAMFDGADICITGAPVSRGLLDNLYEFQTIFAAWFSELRRIDIFAEEENRNRKVERGIAAFSGGIDSSYTVLRQLNSPNRHWDFDVDTAVIVDGFDILVSNPTAFQGVYRRLQKILANQPINLVMVKTNIREVYPDWGISHGLAVAASLSLLAGRFDTGMIASTIPYNMLYPWGSNAITDRLMGSQAFRIVHDGGEFDQLKKIRYLSQFPDAIRHLRFCWENHSIDTNCGHCQKCILTAILMSSIGLEPDCFDDPPSDKYLGKALGPIAKKLRINHLDFHDLVAARDAVRDSNITVGWYDAAESAIREVRDRLRPA